MGASIDIGYQNSFDIDGNGTLSTQEILSIQLNPEETVGSYISNSKIDGNSVNINIDFGNSNVELQNNSFSYKGTDINVNGTEQGSKSKEENHLSAEELAVLNDVMAELSQSGALGAGGLIKSEIVQQIEGESTLVIQCGIDLTGNGIIDNFLENSMISLEQKDAVNSVLDLLRQFPGLESLNTLEKFNDKDRNMLKEFGIELTNNMGEGV